METISSFSSLTTITDRLLLYDNDNLTSISGFDVLATVTGSLQIGNSAISITPPLPDGNDVLTSLPTFSALKNLGFLHIVENDALTTLPTFEGLTGITGNILINNNIQLTAVSGFGALTTVEGDFVVSNNDALETVSGFGLLATVGNNFTISDNDALTSILGFGSLTTITRNLSVQGNTALSSCCGLLSIAKDDVTPGGSLTISGNAAGCNDKAQITSSCSASLTISQDSDVPGNVATLVRITGDLTIGGAITTFPDFAALRVVEGNLTISGLSVATLTDLADIFPLLEEVKGNLLIQNNANVATITGFVALREVGGNVEIGGALPADGNVALTAAPALDALATIGGNLVIGNNGVLTTSPVLSVLTTLVGNFTLQDNAQLASCCASFPLSVAWLTPAAVSQSKATPENVLMSPQSGRLVPPEVVHDENLTITTPETVPGNATTLTRITGNLTISGTIRNSLILPLWISWREI